MVRRGQPKKLPNVLERAEADAIPALPNVRCRSGLRNRAILETMYRAGLRAGSETENTPLTRWKALDNAPGRLTEPSANGKAPVRPQLARKRT